MVLKRKSGYPYLSDRRTKGQIGSALAAHGQNGIVSKRNNPGGNASHKQLGEARPAVRANDDQIGV
jgi:hypothetical protein